MVSNKIYFIHIPKTAGTAVVNTLSALLGEQFVTMGHCTCNGKTYPWVERAYTNTFNATPEIRSHDVIFTVVRNPFDLLVSLYTYGIPYTSAKHQEIFELINFPFRSFRDFVQKLCATDDFPWYCPPQSHSLFFQLFDQQGIIVPHFAVKQEMLVEGLGKLCKNSFDLNIGDIPIMRRTREKQGVSYEDFYDEELKKLVEDRFIGDLRTFGYAFGANDGNALIDCSGITYSWKDNTYSSPLPSPVADAPGPLSGKYADVDIHEAYFLSNVTKGYSSLDLLKVIVQRQIGKIFSSKETLD